MCKLISRTRFHFSNEDELQAGLAQLLDRLDLSHTREYSLAPYGRIDFKLHKFDTGIETKTQGSPSAVIGQLMGYAKHPEIQALIIITSRLRLGLVPNTINNKPLYSIPLWANGL